MRILIVEDDIFVAMGHKAMVESLGHDLVIATTVAQAMAELRRDPPDFTLLDVNLGSGTTSEPVARALRAAGSPFAFVTAYRRDAVPFARPEDPVLTKPVRIEAIRRILPDRD